MNCEAAALEAEYTARWERGRSAELEATVVSERTLGGMSPGRWPHMRRAVEPLGADARSSGALPARCADEGGTGTAGLDDTGGILSYG